jgi:hypothetical protein
VDVAVEFGCQVRGDAGHAVLGAEHDVDLHGRE